jgi:UV DNA damage endonuclease
MSMTIGKVGFACKYMHPDQTQSKKLLESLQRPFSEKSTTITWLNAQRRDDAEMRLWNIMVHNTQAVYNLIHYTGHLPESQRMVRLGSNQLPAYTHPDWRYFWQRTDVREYAAKHYAVAGELARELGVRLSMHPGQFTVLASENADIVNRSIEEFEYHADIIRWMGYGKSWQDFKCNVHISGRKGPAGIRAVLPRLSTTARNCITIENDENAWGLDASLELEKDVALVLDIHHHWCHSAGEYIETNDDRVKRIIDSWRGVRPVIHYSVSREDLLTDLTQEGNPTVRPEFQRLVAQGYKKAKLRAHSDYMWNTAVNAWAGTFRKDFDIMVEAKAKNLASIEFEKQTGVN